VWALCRLHNAPPPTTLKQNDLRYEVGQQLRDIFAKRIYDLWTQTRDQTADTDASL
jgi:hypothetical protein